MTHRFETWTQHIPAVHEIDSKHSVTQRALDFAAAICGHTAIIVDGSNVFNAGRNREFRVDFTAIRQFFGGDALTRAVFVGSRASRFRPSQVGFGCFLRRTGWVVNNFRLLSDGAEDELAVDGDVRAEIRKAGACVDVKSIVLLSGDGGMTNAVRDAQRQGKRVFVVAWGGSLHPALAAAASRVALLDDLAPLLTRFH